MPETADAWIKLLTNLPFAVVVAVWALYRLDQLMIKLTANQLLALEILRRLDERTADDRGRIANLIR